MDSRDRGGPEAPSVDIDIEGRAAFYLGRTEESAPYLYPHKHLLTHAVVIGMTGSGKTGLSVALLEEAALDGVPAIVIDPKGDIGNLLLTFPALDAASFAPYVPEGEDPEAVASRWRAGLAAGHQDGARVARLREAADFAIYTPGSRTGIPVSIVGSLAAPSADLVEDGELFRERVATVATSLLGLVGVDADPVKSREHILLSTLLAQAWQRGQDLDLSSLVLRIREPGLKKVGVLDLESFYPERDRFTLAVAFNNLLAAPGFEAWLEGAPLDVGAFLRTKEGKPRVAIFSIAHLGDAERMFFVSVLLAQVVAWMRAQSGATSLRALLFMDEIVGYFPPVKAPPSKAPLLLLLKQARAFGLGVVLATQNPVDIDYKGLSNCGTWFLGRLQTERDKARVLEGLEGSAQGRPFDKVAVERTLAGLPPRTFVVHDVREDGPFLMESRFCLSYLKGPLRRDEVRALMAAHPARVEALAPEAAAPPAGVTEGTSPGALPASGSAARDKPAVPDEVTEVFLPASRASTGAVTYAPALVARVSVRFVDPKTKLDYAREGTFTTPLEEGALGPDWTRARWSPLRRRISRANPCKMHVFARSRRRRRAQELRRLAARARVVARRVAGGRPPVLAQMEGLRRAGRVGGAFRGRLELRAREEREAALEALNAKYSAKFEALREKLQRAHAAVVRDEAEARVQGVGSAFSVGAQVMSLFGARSPGRRILGGAAQVTRQAGRLSRARDALEEKRRALTELQAKGQALDAEYRAEAARVTSATASIEIESALVRPKKTHIEVRLFALAWCPVE